MGSDLLLRLLFATGTILLGVGVYQIGKRILIARARGRRLGLESLRPGLPAILYFTTPECVPCKSFQRPELMKLQVELGSGLQIIEIDATERPDLANYWGVLSVPTTFIIDSKGEARGMNFGPASAERLYQQISEVESSQPQTGLSGEGVSQ